MPHKIPMQAQLRRSKASTQTPQWGFLPETHLAFPPISSPASSHYPSSRSLLSFSSTRFHFIYFLFFFFPYVNYNNIFLSKIDYLCWNFIEQVGEVASRTKTLAGHNLEPTPWHLFPPRTFKEKSRHSRTYKILQCSYLTCPTIKSPENQRRRFVSPQPNQTCPEFFRSIRRDLEPWTQTGISMTQLMEAKKFAAIRVVIVGGRLFVDLYYDCVQSRAMFTIWGILQLIKKYPGMVPDVDMMFDCMDKPSISKTEHTSMPLPLFRYCTNENHFDIPFPDWSFWGW